jgi:hypothetical protein
LALCRVRLLGPWARRGDDDIRLKAVYGPQQRRVVTPL